MKPYFISDLQKHLQELPEGRKQELRLLLQVNEKEEYRKLSFAFPCEELLLENRALYRNYLLAMINNMLVSFGGARLLIYRKEGSAPLDRLLAEVIAEFQQENPRNDRTGYGVRWRRNTVSMFRRTKRRSRRSCGGRLRSLREPASALWMWAAIPLRGRL